MPFGIGSLAVVALAIGIVAVAMVCHRWLGAYAATIGVIMAAYWYCALSFGLWVPDPLLAVWHLWGIIAFTLLIGGCLATIGTLTIRRSE